MNAFAAMLPVDQDASSSPPATVFVVDEYEAARLSLIWLLEAAGIRAEAFATAEAFLDACDGSRPGCIVADLGFRGRQGLELLERLRQRNLALPVIFLDGNGDESFAAAVTTGGEIGCLGKPFRDDALLQMVQVAMSRRSV